MGHLVALESVYTGIIFNLILGRFSGLNFGRFLDPIEFSTQGRGPEGMRGGRLRVLLRRPVLHVRHAESRLRPFGRQGDQALQEDRRARGQLGPRLRL